MVSSKNHVCDPILKMTKKSTKPKHTRYIDIETVVVIVGARPAGLATSVCVNQHSIPNVILEKEEIYASLTSWFSNICLYKLTLNPKRDPRERRHLCITCELPFMMHGPNISYFLVFAHTYHYGLVSLYNNIINEHLRTTQRENLSYLNTRYIDIETVVVIVGARPAGLATSVCLNLHSISNVILEKEDIYASPASFLS
ncbi:hypothetical protein YC2023_045630 [Brassica napus]